MTLKEIERWVGQPLPDPYRTFLGVQEESLPVGDFVLLYGRRDFVERNETTQVKEYCPGHVTVGDDGGGPQFVLALHDGRLFLVDAGAMTPDCFHPVADDFALWRADGCRFEGDDED